MSYLAVFAALAGLAAAQNPPAKSGKLLQPGTKAPDFSLTDAKTRQTVALSKFKGRPVVVLFWTLDNIHSRTFVNELEALARRHGSAALAVLAVNVKDEGNSLFDFVRDRTFTSFVLMGGSTTATRYGVGSPPAVFVLDAGGVVRDARQTGYTKDVFAAIEAGVKELLPSR
jgi:peroxiredoxin